MKKIIKFIKMSDNKNEESSIDFKFEDIEKFAIDLLHAKEDPEGNIIRETYSRYVLVNREWQPLSSTYYFSQEFGEYMRKHFNPNPILDDEGKTLIYIRKENIGEEKNGDEGQEVDSADMSSS